MQMLPVDAGRYSYRIAPAFKRNLDALPGWVRQQVGETVRFLITDAGNPGLGLKKVRTSATGEVWEARVTRGYRLLYQRVDGLIYLWRVGPHEVIDAARRLGGPDLRRALVPEQPAPAPAPPCACWACPRSGSRRCAASRLRSRSGTLTWTPACSPRSSTSSRDRT